MYFKYGTQIDNGSASLRMINPKGVVKVTFINKW